MQNVNAAREKIEGHSGSEEWEKNYMRFFNVVTDPQKLFKVLKSWNLDRDARVLDMCCGTGGSFEVFKKARLWNLFGLDISMNLLSRVKNGVPLMLGDAHNCPIKSNSFDAIVVNKALHHFLEHKQLLSEIKRVLKPTGYFCFIEPRKTWFRDLYHVIIFSPFVNFIPYLVEMRNNIKEEEDTYFYWLNNAHEFFKMIEEQLDFTIESMKQDHVHYMVKCRGNAKPFPEEENAT